MRKEYRSSNVRFCMDDENQRRTWEYLQSITRKEGSYGKILSDAFVQILDGNHAIEQEALQQKPFRVCNGEDAFHAVINAKERAARGNGKYIWKCHTCCFTDRRS